MDNEVALKMIEHLGEFGAVLVVFYLLMNQVLAKIGRLPSALRHKSLTHMMLSVLIVVFVGAALWARAKAPSGNPCTATGNIVSGQGNGSSASVCNQGEINSTGSANTKPEDSKPEVKAGSESK